MAKNKRKNKKVRPPRQEKQQEQQAEPQQKDDRVSAKEMVGLLTAIILLLVKGSK